MKDLKQELEALSTLLYELREAMNHSLNLLNSRIEDALKEADVEPEKQKPTVRLIPFDIDKAKQGAKIVTREEGRARILCYDRKSEDYPIVAAITSEEEPDKELIEVYTNNGEYYGDGDKSEYDLFILED